MDSRTFAFRLYWPREHHLYRLSRGSIYRELFGCNILKVGGGKQWEDRQEILNTIISEGTNIVCVLLANCLHALVSRQQRAVKTWPVNISSAKDPHRDPRGPSRDLSEVLPPVSPARSACIGLNINSAISPPPPPPPPPSLGITPSFFSLE